MYSCLAVLSNISYIGFGVEVEPSSGDIGDVDTDLCLVYS